MEIDKTLAALGVANKRLTEAEAKVRVAREHMEAMRREEEAAREHKYKVEALLLGLANSPDGARSLLIEAAEDDR